MPIRRRRHDSTRLWLIACGVLVSLGLARPAHAEKVVVEAETTKFAITVDLAGACLCAATEGLAERVASDAGCDGLCSPEVIERARQTPKTELVLGGLFTTTEGASMLLTVLAFGEGAYDPNDPLLPRVRNFLVGFTAKSEGKPHGLDEPNESFDLGELGEIPFARFVVETHGMTMLTHGLFGTDALVAISVTSSDASTEQIAAFARPFVSSVRMPASKPRQMVSSEVDSEPGDLGRFFQRLVPVLLVVGLLVWLMRRRKS